MGAVVVVVVFFFLQSTSGLEVIDKLEEVGLAIAKHLKPNDDGYSTMSFSTEELGRPQYLCLMMFVPKCPNEREGVREIRTEIGGRREGERGRGGEGERECVRACLLQSGNWKLLMIMNINVHLVSVN